MSNLDRRVSALEGEGRYWTLGQMLDSLDGFPLPSDRVAHPNILAALAGIPSE